MTTLNLPYTLDFGVISEDDDTSADGEATLRASNIAKFQALGSKTRMETCDLSDAALQPPVLGSRPCIASLGSVHVPRLVPSFLASGPKGAEDKVSFELRTPRINGEAIDSCNQEHGLRGKSGPSSDSEANEQVASTFKRKLVDGPLQPPLLRKRPVPGAARNDPFSFARQRISNWVGDLARSDEEPQVEKSKDLASRGYKIQKTDSELSQDSSFAPALPDRKELTMKKVMFQCLGAEDWLGDRKDINGCMSPAASMNTDGIFSQLRKNTQDTIATREFSPMTDEFPSSTKKHPSLLRADFRHKPFVLDDDDSDEESSNGNKNLESDHDDLGEVVEEGKKSAKAILFYE